MKKIILGILMMGGTSLAFAKGPGTTAGLTMLRTSGARISALANAGSVVRNDITALGFNPASLGSLSSGQAYAFYERGLADDTYGQMMVGTKFMNGSFGLSAGRYDAGQVELFDGVNPGRTVSAQRDMAVNLGYGFSFRGMEFGAGLRYLTSTIAESKSANATGVDLGANIPVAANLRAGVSLPVYQTKLSYGSTAEDMPRIARAGLSYDTKFVAGMPLMLLAEVPYYVNEHERGFNIGMETRLSVLALRLGYAFRPNANEFSIGTGFAFRNVGMDYSFGLVQNELNSIHKLGLSFKFGE
jgi:hypothetical protein